MNVKELIEILKELPDDAEVLIPEEEGTGRMVDVTKVRRYGDPVSSVDLT